MNQPPIDETTLSNLLDSIGGDREFLRELIDTFFQDAPEQFEGMQSALSAGDAESFRRAAHSLKSNAASFGAVQLSALSKQLEDLGKAGDLSSAGPLLEEAKSEYAQVRKALEEEVPGA